MLPILPFRSGPQGYARRLPELGYTQGMCFLALVTCSKGKDLAEQLFEDYMTSLKPLGVWNPEWSCGVSIVAIEIT